jgi:ABC-2 type transport system ATP-binding protein
VVVAELSAGDRLAVDDISFVVAPGKVTGFLGPNGAGKSTTMRLMVGLDAPTSGQALINGCAYAAFERPLREVGVLLEARAVHTGRSARDHVLAMAATAGISARRVGDVIDMVGRTEVASKRVGGFSLGKGQRLGIANALLADPEILMLDEPINGLDPDGIRWIRNLLNSTAPEGRTAFWSSHLMSEMAQTADHVIVIGQGRILRNEPIDQFIAEGSAKVVKVRSPQADQLMAILQANGTTVRSNVEGTLEVDGLISDEIGTLAAGHGTTLFELGHPAGIAGRGLHGHHRRRTRVHDVIVDKGELVTTAALLSHRFGVG